MQSFLYFSNARGRRKNIFIEYFTNHPPIFPIFPIAFLPVSDRVSPRTPELCGIALKFADSRVIINLYDKLAVRLASCRQIC